jgi:4-hydroxy-tetrahydrodipicolinate synthase
MDLPRPFRGIVPPLVTPLRDYDTVDPGGLERLVDSVTAGGVRGLFILGTSGEAPGLSYRLRREVIERVCSQAAARLPVIVGVSDTSLAESLRLAEHAARCGACAVVTTAPYYYPISQSEMLAFLERVSGDYPLPLFLYDLPSHVRFRFEAETVRRASSFPNICGIKDSSGDFDHFLALRGALAENPAFSILVGPEQLLAAAVSCGAHGGVCGGANLYPELYVALFQAAVEGNDEEVARLHDLVMRICDRIYTVEQKGSDYLRGLKCALAWKGVCEDFMAEPYTALCDELRAKIGQSLVDLGMVTAGSWTAVSKSALIRTNRTLSQNP